MHRWFSNRFEFLSAVGFDGDAGSEFDVDSKAMRRVNDDQEIIVVAEFSGSGAGFTLSTAGRILIKES